MSFKIIKELSLKIKKAVPILLLLITTSCSNGKVGYWEFKIIEKSINTIENIIKIPRKKSSQRIEIPKAPEPPKELKEMNRVVKNMRKRRLLRKWKPQTQLHCFCFFKD